MALGGSLSPRVQSHGTARCSTRVSHGTGDDLYGPLLHDVPCGCRLQERNNCDFTGNSVGSRVLWSSHAAVRLAVHGGVVARSRTLPADGKRPLAVATVVCAVD